MTDDTAGGLRPSTTERTTNTSHRRLVTGPECARCHQGRDITPTDVTSPIGRTFTIPRCFSGALDERTGIPLSACANCKRCDQ